MWITKLFLLFFACTAMGTSEIPEMNFKVHYEHLDEKRHPNYKNGEPWLHARKYIRKSFQYYGLNDWDITEQTFTTEVSDKKVEGVNIIGVRVGENKTGPIIVVGADYSTSLTANQNKDNTGGVASLLEIIHVFVDRVKYNPYYLNNTVIFVAFDLNTKEYHNFGNNKPGSYYFVNDWLIPYMQKIGEDRVFGGAIILDSITTYNMAERSQKLPNGYEEAFPESYKTINESRFKGDFMGLLYSKKENQNPIIKTFTKNFNKELVSKSYPFRLQEMELGFTLNTIRDDVYEMFNHQSHFYFWTHEPALPAFLLFDTDSNREDPDGMCRLNCTVEEFLTEERIQFLEKTTESVCETLMDLQTTKYEYVGSSTSTTGTVQLVASALFVLVCTFIRY